MKIDFQAMPFCAFPWGVMEGGGRISLLILVFNSFIFQCAIEESGSKTVLKIKRDGEWNNNKE